jgi:L-lactate dehydrogenase
MRIAIVGAGSVGATLAYACLLRGVGGEIVLHDMDEAKVDAQVQDLRHGLGYVPAASVWGGSDLGVCQGADVVVVTAGAKQQPGQSRLDLAAANVALCRELVPALVATCPDALLLMVTNPVDVVTMAALRLSGLPPHRVLGSGTVLDSARLRQLLAERCRVAVPNVHAMIAGEHGDSEIALWSVASIGGVPVRSWRDADGTLLAADELDQILDRVRGAAYRIIAGKGATNFAIGLAGARILEAIERDEHRVLPLSAQVTGSPGLDGVCLALPRILGRDGVSEPLDVHLDDDERAGIRASAEAIRSVASALGVA